MVKIFLIGKKKDLSHRLANPFQDKEDSVTVESLACLCVETYTNVFLQRERDSVKVNPLVETITI